MFITLRTSLCHCLFRSSELNHERLRDPLNGAEDAHGRPRHVEERPRTGTTVDPLAGFIWYDEMLHDSVCVLRWSRRFLLLWTAGTDTLTVLQHTAMNRRSERLWLSGSERWNTIIFSSINVKFIVYVLCGFVKKKTDNLFFLCEDLI